MFGPLGGGRKATMDSSTSNNASKANSDEEYGEAQTLSSSDDNRSDVADGEWRILVEGLEEPPAPGADEICTSKILQSFGDLAEAETAATVDSTSTSTNNNTSRPEDTFYGHPLSPEQAAEEMPITDNNTLQGLVWHCTIIPNGFFDMNGKLCKGLNPKDYDPETKTIKPRRASMPVTERDFFSSLTKVKDADGNVRYIFHGALNGWPGLQTLELVSLEQKRERHVIPSPKDFVTGRILWTHVWEASEEGAKKGVEPSLKDPTRVHRAKLRAAPWSALGWSKESLGYVFWFEAQCKTGPRVLYGTDLTRELCDSKCTAIHMISHRYARRIESPKDRLTYHSVCLLEWDHGEYCTVVESAYLNGMGGYSGKSNWYDDKDDGMTALYRHLPPEMIAPWRQTMAEIRAYDVPYKNHEDFKSFVWKYAGNNGRFIDPQFHFSHPARLTFRSKKQIAQYLINYSSRDTSYAELKRNCQTFCADLSAFLAGKKGIVPFHPVSRVEYNNRTYLFLYDSSMYESKEVKKLKRKTQQK